MSPALLARARQLASGGALKSAPAVIKAGRLPRVGMERTAGAAVKLFDAAGQNRLTSDWVGTNRLSADAELQGKLPILRSRSRDLESNDPYFENFLKLRENNVVGHDGFTLQMKVLAGEPAMDPETGQVKLTLDHLANWKIQRGWKRFCQRENFLVTRTLHATEACKLIERTVQRDADLLIRKVKGAPNRFGFALQLFEADYLDDQFIEFRGVPCNCPEERRLPDGRPFPRCERGYHEVRMGVELHGDWKFPVAYWLLANHPGDYFFGNQYATRRIRVLVEEIIHPFVYKRIEQTRGVPAAVASMLRLQMLGGMDEAALVTARAGAQKMGVITKTVPEDFQADDEYVNGTLGRTIDSGPGEFFELPMGFDVKSIDWKTPDQSYSPFQKTQLRGAACGLGVSYPSLANDLEAVNYSSGRLGALEEREGYRGGQQFFIEHILREIFPAWLESAMLSGEVDLPFSRFEAYTDPEAVVFVGRGFPWVDPSKDVDAALKAIEGRIETRTNVLGELGKNFDEVTATLEREEQILDAAGLTDEPTDPAGDDPAPNNDPTPASRLSVADMIGGKVGTLEAMLRVVEKVPDDKAAQALQVMFGLTPEMAEQVVELLQDPQIARAAAELAPPEEDPAAAAAPKPAAKAAPSLPAPRPKTGAVKSAFLGDTAVGDLPTELQETILKFAPCEGTHRVARYGMTVPELLDKADQHNLEAARDRIRPTTRKAARETVLNTPARHILLLNDRIVDGHHFLAKAERGRVTSSLPVLDLTPLRFQSAAAAAVDDDSKKKP